MWVCEHDTCKAEDLIKRIRAKSCFVFFCGILITLGYAIQGLSPQLQHWRTLFLVCDTEGRPSFCQALTYVSTTRTADDDDIPCPCPCSCSCASDSITNFCLRDLLHFRFGDNVGIQFEVRKQIVRKSSCDRHRHHHCVAVRPSTSGGGDYDFETSGGTQD